MDTANNITYIITGVDRNGRRFKITTKTPQHYNIWRGTLWIVGTITGRRTRVCTYWN